MVVYVYKSSLDSLGKSERIHSVLLHSKNCLLKNVRNFTPIKQFVSTTYTLQISDFKLDKSEKEFLFLLI